MKNLINNEDQTEDFEIVMEKSFKNKLKKIARSKGLDVSTLARMWLIEKANETLALTTK